MTFACESSGDDFREVLEQVARELASMRADLKKLRLNGHAKEAAIAEPVKSAAGCAH